VGDATFLWTVSHEHRAEAPDDPVRPSEESRYRDCCEVLSLRRHGARGRLLIAFAQGDAGFVSDGMLPAGAVGTAGGEWLNLHEPGTVRWVEALRRDPRPPVNRVGGRPGTGACGGCRGRGAERVIAMTTARG
jgi:hypothetical protein